LYDKREKGRNTLLISREEKGIFPDRGQKRGGSSAGRMENTDFMLGRGTRGQTAMREETRRFNPKKEFFCKKKRKGVAGHIGREVTFKKTRVASRTGRKQAAARRGKEERGYRLSVKERKGVISRKRIDHFSVRKREE